MSRRSWIAVVLVSAVCGAAAGFLAGRSAVLVRTSGGPGTDATVVRTPEGVPPGPGPGTGPGPAAQVGSPGLPSDAPLRIPDGPPDTPLVPRQEPVIVQLPELKTRPAPPPGAGPGEPAPNP